MKKYSIQKKQILKNSGVMMMTAKLGEKIWVDLGMHDVILEGNRVHKKMVVVMVVCLDRVELVTHPVRIVMVRVNRGHSKLEIAKPRALALL